VFTRSHTERISSGYARKAAIMWNETLETANYSREAPYSFLGETPCEHRVTPCPLDYLPDVRDQSCREAPPPTRHTRTQSER
jgi:hypothetical protein